MEQVMNLTEVDDYFVKLWKSYSQDVMGFGGKILIAVLIIVGAKILISVSRRLIKKAVESRLHFDETLASVMNMGIRYGVIIISLIMILDILGANTGGLIALLGAAGVAVGFALKDTLSNIASGIVILFLRPFRKGDFIECGGIIGSVQELGLFATVLNTADGINISAPNSCLWGVPLKNYSRNEKRRLDVTVSISYGDSIDTAFQVLNNIINEESRFLDEPPPQVMVQSLGESGLGITLRGWVPSELYWRVYWDQMKNVKEKIQEAGLSIALPRREIRLLKENQNISSEPSIDVETDVEAKEA